MDELLAQMALDTLAIMGRGMVYTPPNGQPVTLTGLLTAHRAQAPDDASFRSSVTDKRHEIHITAEAIPALAVKGLFAFGGKTYRVCQVLGSKTDRFHRAVVEEV